MVTTIILATSIGKASFTLVKPVKIEKPNELELSEHQRQCINAKKTLPDICNDFFKKMDMEEVKIITQDDGTIIIDITY